MSMKINFVESETKSSLIKMVVPLLIAMTLNMAYNIVDSLWVGNLLGKEAMAALTTATPIVLILCSIAMGATNGLTILLSQAIGAKDNKAVKKLLSTSCISSLILCAALTIICELVLNQVLIFLKTPSSIVDMVKNYLSIYFIGFIAVFFYMYFTAVLRSYGNSIFQVMGMLLCTILNGILDPVFINHLGIKGAAIATVISQLIAVMLMSFYVLKRHLLYCKIKSFDINYLRVLGEKALPSVIQQSIPAVSTTFLTSIVSTFGVASIAAYGIIGKLETILFYPAMAFNMALTVIIGQCYGAEIMDKVKEYLKVSLEFGVALLILLSVLIIGKSDSLSSLFLRNNDVVCIVRKYFIILSIGYILNTITNCFLGTINGFGKPMMGMFIMIFYYIVVRMPLAYALSKTILLINGIWWGILVSHIIACFSSLFVYKFLIKNVIPEVDI